MNVIDMDACWKNQYISVNPLNLEATNRSIANISKIQRLYLDIDIHYKEWTSDRIREEVAKVYVQLIELIESSEIPIPTAMVDTGRGYALYYDYENPIELSLDELCKGFEIFKKYQSLKEKHIKVFEHINARLEMLFNKYEGNMADPDRSVLDVSRTARIAGTFNTNSQTYEKLMIFNPDLKYENEQLYELFKIDLDNDDINKLEYGKYLKQCKALNRELQKKK